MYIKNMLLGFLGKKSCSGQLGYFGDKMGSKIIEHPNSGSSLTVLFLTFTVLFYVKG